MKRLKLLRTVPLAGLLAVAGCTALIPAYERPAAPVPVAFPDAASAPTTGAAAASLPWADFVTDPRQRALVDLALKNNRDLRIALLNVEQARAALGVQRADQWPSVGAGFNASRTPAGNTIVSAYSAGLAVSAFELDLFGRVKSLTEAAAARYLASEEGRRAAQVSLVAAVVSADLAVRADDELLQVTQRTLASREDGLKLVRVKFDGGASAEPELRAAESLVATARVSLIALQRQRAQDLNALVLLLGQAVPDGLLAAGTLDGLKFADLPPGLPSDVLLQRPDVRQAEQQLIAANANIGAARAAFFPRITLTGSAGFASSQLSGLFDHTAWSFTGQLLQPLFDAGRNRANLEVAKATRDIAVAQYEKSIQTAFREVSDALAGRATLGEQLRAQAAQTNALAITYKLADLRYRAGAASYLDALDAQRSLFVAQQSLVQTRAAQLQNAVALYRALGGGWTEGPATTANP